jgi:HEAT repeat protein
MTLHPDFLENWALAMARRDEPIESAVIERLLDSKDRAVRVAAMKIVLRNPAIIEPSRRVALLSDPNPWIRAQAIESLADNKDDPQVRRAVIDRLADASSIVRRSSLVWITGTEVELSTVQSYFDDEDATVRAAAVRVAGRIATPATVTKLIQKFADREVLVARQAAEQLAAISSDGINSLLIDALADERDQVASQAARCLGMRQCHGALHTLQSLAGHASITVRVAAYEAIGAIGDPTVIPWLIETVKQETGYPRAAINQALGKLNAKQAIAHLIADCQYPDEKSKGLNPANFTPRGGPGPYPVADTAVATEAIRSLGELGDVAAVPVLILVSRDVLRNEPFWTAVVVSLGQLGEKQARGALVELGVVGTISQGMMGVSLPTTTRVAALRSIAKLELSDTVDVILTMDPQSADLSVRQAAAEVLTQLTGTKYTYRVPVRLGSFFIEDRAEAVDPSPFKLPVAYPVETQ